MRRRNFLASGAIAAARPLSVFTRAVPIVRTLDEANAAFDAGYRTMRVLGQIIVRPGEVFRATGCLFLVA